MKRKYCTLPCPLCLHEDVECVDFIKGSKMACTGPEEGVSLVAGTRERGMKSKERIIGGDAHLKAPPSPFPSQIPKELGQNGDAGENEC